MAPLFAALYSPRLTTQEQAYLRSVVVDGHQTRRRKHRAAKALRQRGRQLDPQAFSLRRRAKHHAGPFQRGGPIGHSVEARVFCSSAVATSPQRATATVHRAPRNPMDMRPQSVHRGCPAPAIATKSQPATHRCAS